MQRIFTRSIQNSLQNLVPNGQEMEHCWETDSESSDEHMFIEDSKPILLQSKLNIESDEDSSMEMNDRYYQILTKQDIHTMNQTLDWCKMMLQPQQKRLSYKQVLIDDTQLIDNHRTLRDKHYKPTANSIQPFLLRQTDTDWMSEDEEEDEDEEEAYKAFEKEQIRQKNRYYRNLKLSQKKNAQKHITRRPLNHNPNIESTMKSHQPSNTSPRDEQIISTNTQTIYKPFYFNSNKNIQNIKSPERDAKKQETLTSILPAYLTKILEESLHLTSKIQEESTKVLNREAEEKLVLDREEEKQVLNREQESTIDPIRSETEQNLIKDSIDDKTIIYQLMYDCVRPDILLETDRVQQLLSTSKYLHFTKKDIRFQLLQKLIDSKNTRVNPQFQQWEIQLINQLDPLYQGELQIRRIQERVLLTNQIKQSSLEKLHVGQSLPQINQPPFQAKISQRKENRKKKKWLMKMTEKKINNFQ